jgi:hypothetical protein
MVFTLGPYTLAGGAEQWFPYSFPPHTAPPYVGPKVATPAPRLNRGGSFAATGQAIRNIGTDVDQRIQYMVRIRNLGGTGGFSLRIGDLT